MSQVRFELKRIHPLNEELRRQYAYAVDFEVRLEERLDLGRGICVGPVAATITVEEVEFRHGKREYHATIEAIEGNAREAVKRFLPKLMQSLG